MALIDQIVNITISQQTQAVPQASFSIPLILGPSARFTDVVRTYTTLSGMTGDGFLTTDPEYIFAEELISQALVPTEWLVGHRTGGAIATDISNVQAVNDSWYGLLVTSDTDADILAGAAYIETQKKIYVASSSDPAIPASGSSDLASTLMAAGYKRTSLLAISQASPTGTFSSSSESIVVSSAAGILVGMTVTNVTNPTHIPAGTTVTQISGTTITISADTTASGAGDTLNFKFVGPEAAWEGGVLPQTPGQGIWAYQKLVGILPDPWTSNQIGFLEAKNANFYVTIGGQNVTIPGIMAGGQFMDITVGIDWLESNLQTSVFALIATTSAAGEKIPYTDQGVSLLENTVRQVLLLGASNGLIDPTSITVTAPPVLSISQNIRATRVFPSLSFSCRLQGAIQSVDIKGVVTV